MRHYDVVIAGASFAGLTCARKLAEAGVNVCVLERQAEPGQVVHTTGLLVREAAEQLQPPPALTRRIEGVRLYAPSLAALDLDAPGYYFLATDTGALLRHLAEQAVADGVELRCGQAFRSARIDRHRVTLNGGLCSARYLVGADGARSRVAAYCGLGLNRQFLRGVEVHLRGVRLPADRLHCFVDAELAPGYIAWALPGLHDTVQLGLACRRPFRPDLPALRRRLAAILDLRGAEIVEQRGGWIPAGGTVHPVARDRVLLAGDAAGLVSPLTAGGIHMAIDSGTQVAEAIAARLLQGAAPPQQVITAAYPGFFWKRQLRWLADRDWDNATIERMLARPELRRFARLVYFHRKGLLSVSGWRAVLSAEALADRSPAAGGDGRIEHLAARPLQLGDREHSI